MRFLSPSPTHQQHLNVEIPSFLTCSACSGLLQAPVMHTSCQLLFCLKCAQCDQICSFCNSTFSVESICQPPKFVVESLRQLMSPCDRCHSMIPRHELDLHMETCPIPCHLGCGAKISPLQQHKHEKELCPMAIVNCSDENHWCDWKGKREQLNTHVQTCPFIGNKEFVSKIQEKLDMLGSKIQKEVEERVNDRIVHSFCNGMKVLESYTFRGKKFVSESDQFVTRKCVFIECGFVGKWRFDCCTFENCEFSSDETHKRHTMAMCFSGCVFSGEGNNFHGVCIQEWDKNTLEDQNVRFSHCVLRAYKGIDIEHLSIENSIIVTRSNLASTWYPPSGPFVTFYCTKSTEMILEHPFTENLVSALNRFHASFGVFNMMTKYKDNSTFVTCAIEKFGNLPTVIDLKDKPTPYYWAFFAEIGKMDSEQELLDACKKAVRLFGYWSKSWIE